MTPVSSYFSKAEGGVHAVLTEDIVCLDGVAVPAGIPIDGHVRSVRRVGWGIRHETASLELEFTRLSFLDRPSLEIESRVLEVDNSRETVKNGVIIGIRSTDTPQGTINSHLKHLPTWNPYTDFVLIAYKATFPIFPEPEIWFGPGTDLRLQLAKPLQIQTALPSQPVLGPTEDRETNSIVAQFPQRVLTLDGKAADVVNLAFVASRKQLEDAFQAAGWVGSDKLSKSAFLREFYAYLNRSVYATGPMRPMLLEKTPPDMLWQSSLNTYSKRHHLRVWKSSAAIDGIPVWIGAATHDVRATLSLRNKRLIHIIDSQIDDERAKIVRDLGAVGCVQSVSFIQRHGLPTNLHNATGDSLETDGKVAFIRLKQCSPARVPRSTAQIFKPGNIFFRYFRRQILTLRSDIWRANVIYGAYDFVLLLSHAAHSLRKETPVAGGEFHGRELFSQLTAESEEESNYQGTGLGVLEDDRVDFLGRRFRNEESLERKQLRPLEH